MIAFEPVRKAFGKWLVLPDEDVLDVAAATLVSNRLKCAPVWLLLIAPPSGMKSELIESLSQLSYVYALSDLTPNTLLSGAVGKGDENLSLILQLDGKVLTFKDFTTILCKRAEHQDAIFAQLREVYDGQMSKAWGTRSMAWKGHVGLLAGCTEVIDARRAIHAQLGERFMFYRIPSENREVVAHRALGNVNSRTEMKKELSAAMFGCLKGLTNGVVPKPPTIPDEYKNTLVKLADLVTYGRVGIHRDWKEEVIEYVPHPEMPGRIVQTLALLAQGLSLVRGRDRVTADDMRVVCKVAADTMFPTRRMLLAELLKETSTIQTRDLAERVGLPTRTVLRHMEDLWVLKCLERLTDDEDEKVAIGDRVISLSRKRGPGGYTWKLTKDFREKLDLSSIFRHGKASTPTATPAARKRGSSRSTKDKTCSAKPI